jgi:hypothetical protein
MSVAPEIAKDLSEKSNQELISILENPADWVPQVIDFARSELTRRSVSVEQIDQRLAIDAKQKAEEFKLRSTQPLTTWEFFFAAICGFIGLIGLIFVASKASRLKSDGFMLKSKKSWQIWGIVFGIKLVVVFVLGYYWLIIK